MAHEKQSATAVTQAVRAPRYDSLAGVGINGFHGQALLSNVSSGGFCMQSKTFISITSGDIYTMQITPESASGIKPFFVDVEVRWMRSKVNRFDAGFLVTKHPEDGAYTGYVNHLMIQAGKQAGAS
jgi:hypothetical protein